MGENPGSALSAASFGRAKAGHFSDGAVAFRYRYIRAECGGRWEIDGDETAVMRRVFRLCLEGLPTCPVARLDESFEPLPGIRGSATC